MTNQFFTIEIYVSGIFVLFSYSSDHPMLYTEWELYVFAKILISPWITDYPDLYRQCSIQDQSLLSIFDVNTGPDRRHKCGYRKRTAPVKLLVKMPLVEERIQLIVRRNIVLCWIS